MGTNSALDRVPAARTVKVAASGERIHVVESPDNWHVRGFSEESAEIDKLGDPVQMEKIGGGELPNQFAAEFRPVVSEMFKTVGPGLCVTVERSPDPFFSNHACEPA